MTKISTIHGVPFSEYSDRSAEAAQAIGETYFPYLSLTAGQLELYLLRQRAKIFQAWAPDMPVYSEAVQMIDRALNGNNAVSGVIADELQPLAAIISNAEKNRKPASRAGYFPGIPAKRVNSPIPVKERLDACLDSAVTPIDRAKCYQKFYIEAILNGGIEKSGHHLVYKSLPKAFGLPQDVSTKRILHQTGVEGMALVGEIDNSLMYLWVENGILLKNIQQGIGPLSSATTSVYLAPDPQQAVDAFKAWLSQQPASNRDRIKSGAIGSKIALDPITAGVIIAIAGALTAAAEMLKEMRKQKAYAMVQAQGFGTNAYSASQSDWLTPGGTPGQSNSLLPWLLIGGAVYLASN